jgi:prepilin-type N-terminal cleavage/methylation domain-containing protein
MKCSSLKNQEGFSLIEIFIVLLIIGIITTFAVITFGSSKVDMQRQAITREFKVYLERARFDSVKRRAQDPDRATIKLISATQFTAALDLNEDGTIQPSEVRTIDFTQRTNTRILVTDTFNYPVTVSFDQRGHATAVDATNTAVSPVFTICSNCSAASPDRSVISISPTGTIAVTRNQADPTTFPTPSISNVNATPNCYVYYSANANANTVCPLQ